MSVKVIVPRVGQSIAEATILKWFKKVGESVEKGEPLLEIGTDKINTEIPAPESGVVESILIQEGETVPVETEIAVIAGSAGLQPAPKEATGGQDARATKTSPIVRRLAEEHHIDLSVIHGTGEGGRVTKEDIQKVIDAKSGHGLERVPMSRMRKLIADHMILSKRTAADLTTFFEVDMTEIARKKEETKITYLPYLVATVAKALDAFPALNASIEGDAIVYKKDLNIGIAIAVDEGLIVPVLKNVRSKSVAEIARQAQDLAQRARNHQLTPDDLQNGTFTITNPGVFGALMGTPIILQPQVAILGFGAVVKRPVVINDAIVIRSMAYLSLTYDHRAMDGATADGFLAHIKQTLENPSSGL